MVGVGAELADVDTSVDFLWAWLIRTVRLLVLRGGTHLHLKALARFERAASGI